VVNDTSDKINIDLVDLSSPFDLVIACPIRKVNEKRFSKRILRVFDALDECTLGQKYLLRILQKTWREDADLERRAVFSNISPDWIQNAVEAFNPVIIRMHGQVNRGDMRFFLEANLSPFMENASTDLKSAVEVILVRSQALFIHGRLLQNGLPLTENRRLFHKILSFSTIFR